MSKKQQSLNEAYQELQGIVEEFDSGEVDLEKSLPKFKKGLELAGQIKKKVSSLKNEVEELKADFDDTT